MLPLDEEDAHAAASAAGPLRDHWASAAPLQPAALVCTGLPERRDVVAAELCREWEAWANAIVQAADAGAELPEPPLPRSPAPGVPLLLARVMEASAHAAAALARSSAGAQERASAFESELVRSRAESRRLQAEQQHQLRKQEEGRSCGRCSILQRRVAELGSEVERLRVALRDSDLLRRKEVEDAWCQAEGAEAKLQNTLGAMQQLLAQGSAEGTRGRVAASVALQPVSPRLAPPRPTPLPHGDAVSAASGLRSARRACPGQDDGLAQKAEELQLLQDVLVHEGREGWRQRVRRHSLPCPQRRSPLHTPDARRAWADPADSPDRGAGSDVMDATRLLEREVMELCHSLGGVSAATATNSLPMTAPPGGGGSTDSGKVAWGQATQSQASRNTATPPSRRGGGRLATAHRRGAGAS